MTWSSHALPAVVRPAGEPYRMFIPPSSLPLFKAIGQPVARFGADVARPDFPFNDLTGQDWDYLLY